jgi:hypothetical protein
MVMRFPSPREKALAGDITDLFVGEDDEAVILNALILSLAQFLGGVQQPGFRRLMGEFLLKTAIPDMLHILEAEHNEDAGC